MDFLEVFMYYIHIEIINYAKEKKNCNIPTSLWGRGGLHN